MTNAISGDQKAGDQAGLIGNFNALHGITGQAQPVTERLLHLGTKRLAGGRSGGLHPFAGQVISGGAQQFGARRQVMPRRQILRHQPGQPVAHRDKGGHEGGGSGIIALVRHRHQGRTNLGDLTDPGPHFQREVQRQGPDIVGGEKAEHRSILWSRSGGWCQRAGCHRRQRR